MLSHPGKYHCSIMHAIVPIVVFSIFVLFVNLFFQTVKAYVGPQITTSLRNPYIFMLFKQSGQLTVSQEWRNRIEQNIAGNVTIPDLTANWNLGL